MGFLWMESQGGDTITQQSAETYPARSPPYFSDHLACTAHFFHVAELVRNRTHGVGDRRKDDCERQSTEQGLNLRKFRHLCNLK